MKRTLLATLSTLLAIGSAISASAAPAIKVDCNRGGSISATLAHLAQIGSARGITILVSGTCNENITISGFDHLMLKAGPQGATLQDSSGGNAAVVFIVNSYDVMLQGFAVSGVQLGVNCAQATFCTLNSNTVQGAGNAGVIVIGSRALLTNNNISHNGGDGTRAQFGGSVETSGNSISNNGGG